MCPGADNSLHAAIEQLAVPGVIIGYRLISPGDECRLIPEEFLGSPIAKVRRSSGAARIVARELLSRAGCQTCALPKAPSGAPIWPLGIVGSLAHDPDIAVAAVARDREFENIGIDIEPAEALPIELLKVIATPSEQSELAGTLSLWRPASLCCKRSCVQSQLQVSIRIALDHQDIK